MNRIRLKSLVASFAAAALLTGLAACGSDSSGEDSSAASSSTEISIASPTSPITISTETTTTAPGGGGKKKPAQTTTSAPAGSESCIVPDAFQDFKYTGVPCTSAVIVAQAWDANGKTCNTIDNPNSPDGYNRTCSVEGFTCRAKRDVHSDNRFVTCTQGGQSIRFTWLPA